jgi:hypothetical protein
MEYQHWGARRFDRCTEVVFMESVAGELRSLYLRRVGGTGDRCVGFTCSDPIRVRGRP